jgi:esterase/lipase
MMEQDFQKYISQSRSLIANSRLDLANNPKAEIIIAANSPFELKPIGTPRGGVLLLHGLYDCPFLMKDIGVHLQAQGYAVRSVLFPGHGTVPGALLKVKYHEWLQSAAYGIKSFANEVDNLWIAGFSTGGAVALWHVLEKQFKISGMILLAPAIQISALSPLTKYLPTLGKIWEKLNWLHQGEEVDYTKYESYTFNSVYQIYSLTKVVERLSKKVNKIDCPMLMILSQDDKTISSAAAIKYFKRLATADSKMILYTNNKTAPDDTRIITRAATYEKWNIQNISHVALSVAPDNFHYGMHGDCPLASHVEDNKKIYSTDNNHQNKIKNISSLNLKEYQRLTFNPDFDFLKETISAFMQRE